MNSEASLQASKSITLSGANATIAGRLNSPSVDITGTSGLTLDSSSGYISADDIILAAPSGTVTLSSAINGTGGVDAVRLQSMNISGSTVVILSDFALAPSSSDLTVGSGGVVATGYNLSGFDKITLNSSSYLGNSLSVNTLTFNIKGDLLLTGDLYAAKNASTPGGLISVAGNIGGNVISAGKSIDADSSSAQSLTAGTVLTLGSGSDPGQQFRERGDYGPKH